MALLIELIDLKKSINNLLKSIEPSYKIYGNEIKEGFERPCFFVQILPVSGTDLFKSDTLENSYMVEINYFSKSQTQLDNLKMAETLKKKVFPYITIKDRKITPRNVRNEDIEGILSFRFNLSWLDSLERKECEEKATNLILEMRS